MTKKPGLLLLSSGAESLIAADVAERFDIVRLWEAKHRNETLDASGDRIEAILSTQVDAALMQRLPALRLIVVPGAGYDQVDVAHAKEHGIRVVNAGDAHSEDVADHAVAMTLAMVHRLPAMDRWVRDGQWREGSSPGRRRAMSSHRFGIVGLGNIGRLIAQKIDCFGGEIAWWGPRSKDTPWRYEANLPDLARWSSVFIVSTRGDATGLIDRQVIDAVGADGTIVNITRGPVVDEDALIDALTSGRLGAAALDVFAEEPTPNERWRHVPNVLLTPHVAGVSDRASARLRAAASTNLRSLLDGTPPVHDVDG